MNRIVVLGVAIFFALVGIALVGGENKAQAFGFLRGGGGCGCNCNGCHGRDRCHGRCHGGGKCCDGGGCCASSCHGRRRCHGRCHGCNGCNGGCGGGVVVVEKGAVQAPVPAPAPVQAK